MKKKFLSAILLGAFMVASTVTFVSCKDYDDDIDNLQGQIDKIATSLTDLQAKVGSFVKSVTYDSSTGVLTVVDSNNSSVTYTIAKNLPTYSITVSADGTVSLLKDNTVVSSGKITFPTPQPVASFDPSKLTVDANTGKVLYNGIATAVVIPSEGVVSIKDYKDANGSVVGYTIMYKNQSVSFGLNDMLTLKALVFKSDLFVNGIEAIEYPYMPYTYLKEGSNTTVTYNDERSVSCTIETPSKEWTYVADKNAEYDPIEYINYHMNPSSAKVVKENLSFISRDVEAISRASVANPTVEDLKAPKDGVIPVGFKAIGSKIATAVMEGTPTSNANIMALQAIVKSGDKDTTITSDYAMLYASTVIPRAIAYSDKSVVAFDCPAVAANPDELYKSVKDAVENAPTLVVAYNSSIDLKTILNIHYDWTTKTKNGGLHKTWNYGDESKYGLKYDYAFIQYKNGTNVTSDSKYASLADGVVTPRIVDANGATLSEQGVSSVGKRPLVRVRILDSNNKVVLYAFIKLEIVKQVGFITTTEFNFNNKPFGCDALDLKLTWAQISYQLLEKAAVQSKDEFDALYQFDQTGGVGNQFVNNAGKYVASTAAQVLGTVTETVDPTGTTNSVLTWTLSSQEQQKIYEKTNHSATIYVRYISKLNTTSHAPIYMPLTVTIEKPQGSVVTKLTNYWYNNLANTRLNVQFPIDNGNTSSYVVDLDQVWEQNVPKFNAPATGFPSYTAATFATEAAANAAGGYKYYFAATQNVLVVDGITYTLSVSNTKAKDLWTNVSYDVTLNNALAHALRTDAGVYTNTTLFAAKGTAAPVVIATIDQATGNITYANNDVSKTLLNAYGHNAAAHFAKIGICAYTGCNIAFALNNGEYPAYFIRPIDPIGNNTGEFVDAQANGSSIDIAKIFSFNDWRDVKFVDGTNYANCWLYAFYGLNKVTVDLAKVTTDLSGGNIASTLLSSKTSLIKLTQLDAAGTVTTTGTTFDLSAYNNAAAGTLATYNAIVTAMGKIKYENNGNNVQTFNLRIPVVFSYTWGDINTYADVVVKGTLGN